MTWNTYEPIEPEVKAAPITGIQYTYADGSTRPAPDTQGVIGSYTVEASDGTDTTVSAADFAAKYQPVAG